MAVMAEIIVHNRNFSKIDTPGQNYVATVIQLIERSHSTASLVYWNNFYCMMKVFCIENTDDGRKYFYWAVIFTEIS